MSSVLPVCVYVCACVRAVGVSFVCFQTSTTETDFHWETVGVNHKEGCTLAEMESEAEQLPTRLSGEPQIFFFFFCAILFTNKKTRRSGPQTPRSMSSFGHQTFTANRRYVMQSIERRRIITYNWIIFVKKNNFLTLELYIRWISS